MAGGALEVVAQIVLVAVADITAGDRLRPVDPIWADALGRIMVAEGQKTPVEVCQLPGKGGFHLVSGGHRHAGAKLHNIAHLKAEVVSADALERRGREISENLWRKGLDPIDRAAFLAELIEVLKAKAGVEGVKAQAVAANARWNQVLKASADDASVTMTLAYGWADQVAERVGLSRKTIYRDLELHRGLRPEIAARLRGFPICSNAAQLRALAKLGAAAQRDVCDMIVAGSARGPGDALAIMAQKPAPAPDAKAWSAFVGGWSRLSAAKRRDALRHLVELGLPKGITISFEGEAA